MTEEVRASSTQGHGAGSAAGTPVIVDVYVRSAITGLQFSHEWRWDDGNPGGKDAIDIPPRQKGQPGTPIHFHLHDKTTPNRGLVFADDAEGPMWVQRWSCPPDGAKCEDPEIPGSEMQLSPNLLKVLDLNNEECSLHYRLRFKDRDGKAESYDPEIRNGGVTN
jgi:hypothetical protein